MSEQATADASTTGDVPAGTADAPPSGTLAALAAAALLAACGPGKSAGDLPEGFRQGAATAHRPELLPRAAPPQARAMAAGSYRVPSAAELFDFAERQYPQFFPGRESNRVSGDIVYRHYPASGNHVGVSGDRVLVLGPMSGGQITDVGSVQSFAAAVFASARVLAPQSDADAARLLLQAQFSASTSEIARVRAMGYEAWLDAQLALPESQTGWDWLQAKGYGAIDTQEFFFAFGTNNFMIWHQLFQSPDAVRRRSWINDARNVAFGLPQRQRALGPQPQPGLSPCPELMRGCTRVDARDAVALGPDGASGAGCAPVCVHRPELQGARGAGRRRGCPPNAPRVAASAYSAWPTCRRARTPCR